MLLSHVCVAKKIFKFRKVISCAYLAIWGKFKNYIHIIRTSVIDKIQGYSPRYVKKAPPKLKCVYFMCLTTFSQVFSFKLFDIINLTLKRSVFLKKFGKKYFWYSYSFWKDLSREYFAVSKFLLEVPKFKENGLICVITAIKVCDILLIPLKVTTIFAAEFQTWMTADYSYWSILAIW